METQTSTNDLEQHRPLAPPMNKNRDQAYNKVWTAYRKEVKRWNRQRFPRETIEECLLREIRQRVEPFRVALQKLPREPCYYYLGAGEKAWVDGLIKATPSTRQTIEAWAMDVDKALKTLRPKLRKLRADALTFKRFFSIR